MVCSVSIALSHIKLFYIPNTMKNAGEIKANRLINDI